MTWTPLTTAGGGRAQSTQEAPQLRGKERTPGGWGPGVRGEGDLVAGDGFEPPTFGL
jgi:hypothetical protein